MAKGLIEVKHLRVVNFLGVQLISGYSMIWEYVPDGPFDAFLRKKWYEVEMIPS